MMMLKKQSSTKADTLCVCMNTSRGDRKGRAGAVQHVSCEAGSEQGQTTEAL